METILLTDPEIEPTDIVLEQEFAALFPVLKGFMDNMKSDEYKLSPEWKYYKDGKAWLCKLCQKKKTVVWLSLWSGSFKLAFYFTEKTGAGIRELNIKDSLKKSYATNKPSGRLKPLVFDINNDAQLTDVYTVIKFKAGISG
jgi:hypothetical protein